MNVLVLCASRFAGWVFCKVLTRLGIAEAQLPAVGRCEQYSVRQSR
jgi:hypothetical protein